VIYSFRGTRLKTKGELCIAVAGGSARLRLPLNRNPLPPPGEQATGGRDLHSRFTPPLGSPAQLPPPEEFLIERRVDVPLLIGAACGPCAEGRQRRACGRTCCRRRRLGSGGAGGARRSLQVTVEPRLRGFEACPARQGGREVDVWSASSCDMLTSSTSMPNVLKRSRKTKPAKLLAVFVVDTNETHEGIILSSRMGSSVPEIQAPETDRGGRPRLMLLRCKSPLM
jgi:hypothetical protein